MPPDPADDRRDEPPTDGDPNDERSRSDDRDAGRHGDPGDGARRDDAAGSSNGDLLSSLLNALESLDRISGSDRRQGSSRRLDYDISIGSGLDALGSGSDERNRSGRPGSGPAHSRGRPSTDRSNRRRRRRTSSSYRTTVRSADERVVVVADVAGADPEDVTVGYDGGDLVVGVDGSEVERVEVPWRDPDATARVNNGVLTVTIERGGERRE